MADSPKDLFDLEALSKESITDLSEQLFQEDVDDAQDGEKYVVFQIDDNNYAIPSTCVSEVIRMLPVTELPNVPQWFVGIANLRGGIVSIIDLPGTWNSEVSDPSQKAKLVVLRADDPDTNLAFRVDRLREIAVLENDQITAPESKSEQHLAGTMVHKAEVVHVLNVPSILSSLTLR